MTDTATPLPFTLANHDDAPTRGGSSLDAMPCCGSLDLRLGCCMDVMKTFEDGHFDLAIVDPPYGIRVGDNKQGMGRRKGDARATYKMGDWDHEAPPVEYFAELRRVSKHQIVWGANHFIERLPINSACWIVWDKQQPHDFSLAAAELAWTSFSSPCKGLSLTQRRVP